MASGPRLIKLTSGPHPPLDLLETLLGTFTPPARSRGKTKTDSGRAYRPKSLNFLAPLGARGAPARRAPRVLNTRPEVFQSTQGPAAVGRLASILGARRPAPANQCASARASKRAKNQRSGGRRRLDDAGRGTRALAGAEQTGRIRRPDWPNWRYWKFQILHSEFHIQIPASKFKRRLSWRGEHVCGRRASRSRDWRDAWRALSGRRSKVAKASASRPSKWREQKSLARR